MVWNEILVNGLVVGLPGDFHGLIVAKWSCGQKCEMVYCFWDCLMEMTFSTGHTCPVFGFISAQWPLNVSTWGNKVFFLSFYFLFFCSLDSEGYPGLGWLHGCFLPCLHWRHQRAEWNAKTPGGGSTHRRWHARPCVWHAEQEISV